MVIKESVYQKTVVAKLPVAFWEAADVGDSNTSEGSGAGGG